ADGERELATVPPDEEEERLAATPGIADRTGVVAAAPWQGAVHLHDRVPDRDAARRGHRFGVDHPDREPAPGSDREPEPGLPASLLARARCMRGPRQGEDQDADRQSATVRHAFSTSVPSASSEPSFSITR